MDIDIDGAQLDFEDDVQRLLPASGAADTVPGGRSYGAKVDPRHRTVVCRHWLHGLCQKVLVIPQFSTLTHSIDLSSILRANAANSSTCSIALE